MSWTFAAVAGGAFAGELDGPVWDGSGLLFANVTKNEILRYDPVLDAVIVFRHSSVRTRGLAFAPDGRLYGAQTRARRVVWYRADGATYYVDSMLDGKRRNEPQHLAIDSLGRIWSTDLWTDESTGGPVGFPPLGHCSVLRLDPMSSSAGVGTWTVHRMTFDTVAPRGIALSADEHTLYVTDAGAAGTGGSVRAYRIREGRALGPASVISRYAPEDRGPAGVCVDHGSGHVIVAAGARDGGPGPRIEVLDVTGGLVGTYDVPADAPTACAFGGPDLDVLFVTTASGELFRATGTGLRGDAARQVEELAR